MMFEVDEAKFKGPYLLVKAAKSTENHPDHNPDRSFISFWGISNMTHQCKYCQSPHDACCFTLDACAYDVPFTLSLEALRLYPGAT